MPPCSAGASSNTRARELQFLLEALVLVVALAGSSEVLDKFLIVYWLGVIPAKEKTGTFAGANIARY